MATRIFIIVLAGMLCTMPARAATSIFPIGVFSSNGVVNPLNALYAPNGAGALVGDGGDIVLQYAHPLTGGGLSATLLPIAGGINIIAASIGEVIGGVAVFSGEFLLVDMGLGGVVGGDFSALCSGVSATGCSLLKLRNAGAIFGSAGFSLDGVSGVTTAPEPGTWALMILGFIGVASRLKAQRTKPIRRPLRGGLLSLA